MSDRFIEDLRVQLRGAAEREERQAGVHRAASALRHELAPRVAAVAAVALAALAVVAADLALRGGRTGPAVPGPRVVADVALTSGGGSMAAGFGAAWVTDPGRERLLRLDAGGPGRPRVTARVPVTGLPVVTAGEGAVWVLDLAAGRLLRVDPDRGAVTARTRLGVGARVAVDLMPGRDAVWVVTPGELLRVDARRAVVDRRRSLLHDGFEATGIADGGAQLYVLHADGVLSRLDARSGAPGGTVRTARPGFLLAAAGPTALVAAQGGVDAVDARTGRTRWRRDLGAQRINAAVVARDAVWLHVTGRGGPDRLVRLDPTSGRRTGALALPRLGAAGLAAVGDHIWVLTPSGRLLVVD